MNTVEILGVNVSCLSLGEILDHVLLWTKQEKARAIYYVNAHCLNVAVQDHAYRTILNSGDLVYPDGISVVWASRLLGACQLEKITGRDWIDDFCSMAKENGIKIYMLGGKPSIVQEARRNLLGKTAELPVVGAHNGYLNGEETEDVVEQINAKRPDVLLVGMGTPLQEKWIYENRNRQRVPVCWTVGAMFNTVAGAEPPVPPLMNALALEWMWRLLLDPIGKWRRYLIGNPLFIYRLLHQKYRKMVEL
ncbi:MAG: WecB/TagA/CpsF family glycosyltransferase [Anaerolineales bacterium]